MKTKQTEKQYFVKWKRTSVERCFKNEKHSGIYFQKYKDNACIIINKNIVNGCYITIV